MIAPHQQTNRNEYQVAAFYCFKPLEEEVLNALQEELGLLAREKEVMGTILLASEGVNGTICGPLDGVNSLIDKLHVALSLRSLEVKVSWSHKQAFRRLKVRRKAEIVTMGVPGVDPSEDVGLYVEPVDWNEFLLDPETLVIDTRNIMERLSIQSTNVIKA